MRTRILALFILFIFIVVPLIGYWYFFQGNTSVITFIPDNPDTAYRVTLEGTLEYDYLPLADKALVFDKECLGSCDIILPPVSYSLKITTSGAEDIVDALSLSLGEGKKYSFQFVDVFTPVRIESITLEGTLESNLLMNANTSLGGGYRHIGATKGGKYYVLRTIDGKSTIGILTPERYLIITTLPFVPTDIALDLSREFIIIGQGNSDQYIISLDGKSSTIFPNMETIVLVDSHNGWKVKTLQGIYMLESGRWKKNPRYTDILDISPTERIGYIDKDDTAKLSLQNLVPGVSVLEYIDRTTGATTPIKKGIDMRGLFHLDGKYAYIGGDGEFYTFSLPDR